MRRKVISILLTSIIIMTATSIGVSAEWKQNSNSQWSWSDSRNMKVTSWNEINGLWYYFDNSGNLKTGWIEYAGQWYYANGSGVMQKGWIKIGTLWYHFGNTGTMDTDKVIDGYYIGEDGIMQDRGQNKVLVDNEYAKVTFIGINRESTLGPKIKVQVENKSDKALCIQTKDDVLVDGSIKNATFSEEILPKGAIIANFTLPSTTDKNFKNVKGDIKIIQKDSWSLLKVEEFSISF